MAKKKPTADTATVLILDGHSSVFTPTLPKYEASMEKTQSLPPLPWWACMVDSTIEFCRIAWNLTSIGTSNVSVMVANEIPTYVIDKSSAGQVDKMMDTFALVQPRQNSSVNRIQLALDKICTDIKCSKVRICLLLMNKNIEDDARLFRNDENSAPCDIRAMIHLGVAKSDSIKELHVDVLRLCPFPESSPAHTLDQRISECTTVSIYNIPHRYGSLKNTLRHLAQVYFNVAVLQVSNIPLNTQHDYELEKSSSEANLTISLFYGSPENPNNDTSDRNSEIPIDDPRYLESRIKRLNYATRNTQNATPDVGWCTCMHPTIPVDLGHTSNDTILDMILQGSVLYLGVPDRSGPKEWSHTLQAEGGRIFLRCLDLDRDDEMMRNEQNMFDIKVAKVEGALALPPVDPTRAEEFSKNLLLPITYDNISQATSLCRYDPYEYTSRWSILPIKPVPITTVYAERITRWYSCFRSSMGTDRFPVKHDDSRRIEDIAYEVTIGSPKHSGFGILGELVPSLARPLDKLMEIFLQDHIPHVDVAISTADLIVSTLVEGMSGSRKRIFLTFYNKDDTLLMIKKLLVALYLVAKRFPSISQSHAMVCKSLKSLLDEKVVQSAGEGSGLKADPGLEDVKMGESNAIEAAWQQATQYQGMSLREKEESVYTTGPMSAAQQQPKLEPKLESPMMSTPGGRGGKGRGKISSRGSRKTVYNPSFKQGQPSSSRKYPNPSVMVPYLEAPVVTIEEKQARDKERKERLGSPGGLLSAYWSAQRAQKLGSTELRDTYDGKMLVYEDNKWKRVQKEVDGRMPK